MTELQKGPDGPLCPDCAGAGGGWLATGLGRVNRNHWIDCDRCGGYGTTEDRQVPPGVLRRVAEIIVQARKQP